MIKLCKTEFVSKTHSGYIGCGTKVGGHGYTHETSRHLLVQVWIHSNEHNYIKIRRILGIGAVVE